MLLERQYYKENSLKILVIVEIMAIICCLSGIFNISYIHIMDMQTRAAAGIISSVDMDTEEIAADGIEAYQIAYEEAHRWKGPVLNKYNGTVQGPSGKETYYNLNMSGVVSIMRGMGNTDEYWVREDGCKMLGDYIMVAANLNIRPRGSLVETSLGTGIVCDTGGFARKNPYQIDIAVNW